MPKQVNFKREAKDRIKVGIDIVCKSIRTTIGPKGRNAFIDDNMQPKITNDGKTIANSITLEDKMENMGAWLVKNASSQTDDDAGDGTSTTSVLLKAIIDEAQKRPESPMDIKRSLMKAGEAVVKMIEYNSFKLEDSQIKSVATISAESEVIGQLITDVIEKAGKNTPISIENNTLPEIQSEIVQGLETNVGYAHHAFINNTTDGTCEMDNVIVLATDRRIGSLPDLKAFLEFIQNEGINTFVLLAPDIDNSVLGILINAKAMGVQSPLVIRPRNAELEDMCAMSGATLISELTGVKLSEFKPEHLGMVKKIIAGDKKTLIINDAQSAKEKEDTLRAMAKNSRNQYEKKFLSDRADKLSGGIAVIKVGAHVDSEREYQKYKIEDAVNATKSALEEGIVEGGGMCLYRISGKLKENSIGEEILAKALKEPLRAIIENCDKDYTEVVKKITKKRGYDAKNDKVVNMFKEGIIDPARVTRCAFQNALENAANYITMEVAIADNNEIKK